MDLPKPPQEIDLRNIIDKLAQFVARNGPEFEQMTKNKQKGNPKFSFLYGGENFNYYQYKVTTEQAILKQHATRDNAAAATQAHVTVANTVANMANTIANNLANISSSMPTMMMTTPTVVQATPVNTAVMATAAAVSAAQWLAAQQQQPTLTIDTLSMQQTQLREQICQSEQNLAAQHLVLMQQQQAQIEDAVRKAQRDTLQRAAEEAGVSVAEVDAVLQPIIDTCTKDSISAGKSWILQHGKADHVIAQCLLQKVVHPGSPFTQKLHIIYLINDVLHHCARKSADELKQALESVVVPMFCNAAIGITDEQHGKLNKLLNLWESKNNYFQPTVIAKMKTPSASWAEYQAGLIAIHAASVTPVTTATKLTYENYQAQHQAFIQHALNQIQSLEQQKLTLEQLQQQPPVVETHVNTPPPPPLTQPPPTVQLLQEPPPELNLNFSQPPPGYGMPTFPPGGMELPDLSKPPPGFPLPPPGPPPDLMCDDLMPSLPYFELPAGLMVPLIKLEESGYKALDPDSIRLPPPAPPSERLLAGVEAFYAPPCHDRPRDSEGWEKLGLYEYYRAKNAARKKKEDDIAAGLRERSRSPSPIVRMRSRSKSPVKKRYRSLSRSRSPESPARSRSRSRSPRRNSRNGGVQKSPRRQYRPSSRSPSRSPSSSRSRSGSPPAGAKGQMRSPERSPTPPSFLGSTYSKSDMQTLSESNKGHQMLRKMGWSGAGLGVKEQGIEQPISGGEVRDRTDMYKGVGINLHDPYESFRKSKGQAFINRMKARAEERI